jgi:hypothetical protein
MDRTTFLKIMTVGAGSFLFSIQVFTKLLMPFDHLKVNILEKERANGAENVYRKEKVIK